MAARANFAGSGGRPFFIKLAAWLMLSVICLVDGARASTASSEFVVDSWQTDAGLPNNSVTSVLQSKDRYLWIGTSNGLARFDGSHFTTYRSLDNPGLRSNRILCLYEDAGGTLWIGTQDGGLVRMSHGQFTPFTTVEGLSSDTVLSIADDEDGSLWVGTAFGLDKRLNGQFSTYFKNDGLPDEQVTSIAHGLRSALFFGTGKGLARMSHGSLGPKTLNDSSLVVAPVKCLFKSHDGSLYAGENRGLFRVGDSPDMPAASQRITGGDVNCGIERSGGDIWYGTSKGDVMRIVSGKDGDEPEIVWHGSSAILALHEDVEGNLWVGTSEEGLLRLKRRELQLIPLPEVPAGNSSPCCYRTPNGQLQMLAGDNSIYACNGGQITAQGKLPLAEDVVVQGVCLSPQGDLWIGTRNDGLLKYRDGTITRLTERDGLSDNSIECLYANEDGGIWLGTHNGGFNYVKDREVSRFNTPWGFSGNVAAVIVSDEKKRIWIGTTGDGLFQMSGSHFIAFTEQNGLPSDRIQALCPDSDGSLWVGTARGLCRVKDGLVTGLAGRGGLTAEAILQLRSDRKANLWIGSSSGIFRIRKGELIAFAEGTTSFVNVVPYGREDGLAALQCLSDGGSQADRAGAEQPWFLTTKGIVMVERGSVHINDVPPAVLLEQAVLDNETLPLTAVLKVPPGKERIQFQFDALSLTAPGKIKFRYQLDPFDRDWSEPGSARTAQYPRIPPGHYSFRVVACNDDGIWNNKGAVAEIISISFWWQTKTFQIGTVVAAVGIFAGFYRLKKSRQRELERLRVRIAGDLHDEIGSSLWSITLLSRMLARHGSLGAQEKQDIEEIHRIAEQTSNSIRDIIWLINPSFNTVQDLLLRTQDFARTILRGVDYRLVCNGTNLSRKLSPDLKQNLFLLFKEALTNIARHSNATVAEVRIEEGDRLWRLIIRDNGVGFQPGALSSESGLRNLQARAKKIGGELEIQSEPGKGTTLSFTTERLRP